MGGFNMNAQIFGRGVCTRRKAGERRRCQKKFFQKRIAHNIITCKLKYHCGNDCATRECDNVVSETVSVIAEKFACCAERPRTTGGLAVGVSMLDGACIPEGIAGNAVCAGMITVAVSAC